MLSIGCGLFGLDSLDQSPSSIVDFVTDPVRLSIKANAVATRFEAKYSAAQVLGKFYRLNVTYGAEKVRFDERKMFEEMEADVNGYLGTFEIQRKLERLAGQLVTIYKARVDAMEATVSSAEHIQ